MDPDEFAGRRAEGQTDFRGIELTGAALPGADLRYCCLAGARLTGLDLRGANFTRADLGQARLTSETQRIQSFSYSCSCPVSDGQALATTPRLSYNDPMRIAAVRMPGGAHRQLFREFRRQGLADSIEPAFQYSSAIQEIRGRL